MQDLSTGKGDRRAPEDNRSPRLTPSCRADPNTCRPKSITAFRRGIPFTPLRTSTRSGRYIWIQPFHHAKDLNRCIFITPFRSPKNSDRRFHTTILHTAAPFGRRTPFTALRLTLPSDRRSLTPHDLPEMRI